MRPKPVWQLGLVSLFIAPSVAAVEYQYSLYSTAEYSDNVRQGASEEDVSGSILTGGVGFSMNTDAAATLAADVVGDISRLHYSDGELENETRAALDATALYQPDSTNFRLAVLESYFQVEEDRRLTRTVNNLRDVNVVSVIPSYFIELTPRSRIEASYNYAKIDDELDIASRDVQAVTVGYRYKVSNLSDWSLHGSRSRTEFDEVDLDFDRESVFFRWEYDGLLTRWMLDLGQQRIVDYDDSDQALVSFSLRRQVNSFSNVGFVYDLGYSDPVDTRVGGGLIDMVPNSDVVFADELAEEEQASVFYEYSRGAVGGRMALESRKLENDENMVVLGRQIDEARYAFDAGLDYRFRNDQEGMSAWGIGFAYRYSDETFYLDDEDNQVHEGAARLDYFATRTTRFFFELRSRNASGTGPRADTDENSFLLGVRFSPRGGG